MHAFLLSLVLLVASDFGGQQPPPPFGGQQPPPVLRWECNCSSWAVIYDWADGTRTAWTGDTSADGLDAMLAALMSPWAAVSGLTECYQACHTLCNSGMPDGSPNAVCSAVWIGANQTCQCVCKDLNGECPPTNPLPAIPPSIGYAEDEMSAAEHQIWTLGLAWHKRHTGR
jgi:hypothetical protein